MFRRIGGDVVKTLPLPILEIFANPEYQERIWINNPGLAAPWEEIFEEFFMISRSLLSHGEEFRLDEKSREYLIELREMIDTFFMLKMNVENAFNLHAHFVRHPNWVKIQNKSSALLKALQPIIATRQRDVITTELIPSIKQLTDRTYQEKYWTLIEDKYAYSNWFLNLSEICDFLLLPSEESLNHENKQRLRDLYKKVDEFDDTWGKVFGNNALSLLDHSDWKKIRSQAVLFLEGLHIYL